MRPKEAFLLLIQICAGLALIAVALTPQTLLTPSQVANLPHIADSRFGFICTTSGSVTTCEVDRAYMLHLLPIPFDGTATPPSPGGCFDTAAVIITKEPAMYFCASPPPGGFSPIWIRVSGVSTW
jgi:hypothetical protein